MEGILDSLKSLAAAEIGVEPAAFSYPPQGELGDLSLACFSLAAVKKQAPAAIAADLAGRLAAKEDWRPYFREIKAVGPYLNFYIDRGYLAKTVIKAVKTGKGDYGRNLSGRGKRVMVEYSNGNTHKEYHVGHLRNISYGDAVNRLLDANGFKSIPVSYINDFGIHASKTIWNWRRHPEYGQSAEDKGFLLGKCYSEASRELEASPESKEEVSAIKKNIEARQGEDYALWQETRKWSLDYFNSIYKELGVRFDHTFYESDFSAAGLDLVKKLLDEGKLRKSEGAIIADFEKEGLGVMPIIRSDGTALYPVADLALAREKFEKFDIQESIYVVDIRQSLYFKQLFRLCQLLGYKQEMRHLPYDFVTLPDGMMASRTGNVITYKYLRDKVWDRLTEETGKRHADWTPDRVRQTAFNLAISTIKFEMLKVGAEKIITFNLDEALRFDGYTACYLQYGYARLKSVIRKEKPAWPWERPDLGLLTEDKEEELLLKIARYPEIVAAAGEKYDPAELTKYLFELVQSANDYYHRFPILKAEGRTARARLTLIKALAQVLDNGFRLLGLKVVEEM